MGYRRLALIVLTGIFMSSGAVFGDSTSSQAQNLETQFLDVTGLRSVVLGNIVENPVVQRIVMQFELCHDFGARYKVYKVIRQRLDGVTYEDIEIRFEPMTRTQFENLRAQYSKGRSRVVFKPGNSYSLVDFLPPQYQVIHAVETAGGIWLGANCWGTAYEMRNPSDSFFYSSHFDGTGNTNGNSIFEDVVKTGKHLGPNPIAQELEVGDLQFFHDPFTITNGEISSGDFSHARSFAACEKNGNHLMFQMPDWSHEPRRFVLSTEDWFNKKNIFWYQITRTNPAFYPKKNSLEFNKNIYQIQYDSDGRAHLKPKTSTVTEYIENQLNGAVMWITRELPRDASTTARKRAAWDLLKREFLKNRDHFDIDYATDMFMLVEWLKTDWNFYSQTVETDPMFGEIAEMLNRL